MWDVLPQRLNIGFHPNSALSSIINSIARRNVLSIALLLNGHKYYHDKKYSEDVSFESTRFGPQIQKLELFYYPDQSEYHTFSLCGMEWRTFSRTVGNTWSMTSSTSFSVFSCKKQYDHERLSRVSPKLTKLTLCTKIIVGRTPI